MTKIINFPGLEFATPAIHATKQVGWDTLTKQQKLAATDPANANDIKVFGLEAFLAGDLKDDEDDNEDDDIFVTRDIERLIANNRYQDAYDLYVTDGVTGIPEDYDVFLAKYV